MLRQLSIAVVAAAVGILFSGGVASAADEWAYSDTESGDPFVSAGPLSTGQATPEAYADTESGDPFVNMASPFAKEMAPIGATGTEAPSVSCPSIPEQECQD